MPQTHTAPKLAAPKLDRDAMETFLATVFPEMDHGGKSVVIEDVAHGAARLRLLYHPRHLRPGGTVSGPSMMALADYALYVAVLSVIGPVELAVTTNFSINFLRKPDKADVIAHARLLKAGKRLCVGEATLYSEGEDEPVAHITATYSVPPVREA